MATPYDTKNPAPEVIESTVIVRSFLGHDYYRVTLSYPCPVAEKKIVKEIHKFYTL